MRCNTTTTTTTTITTTTAAVPPPPPTTTTTTHTISQSGKGEWFIEGNPVTYSVPKSQIANGGIISENGNYLVVQPPTKIILQGLMIRREEEEGVRWW